LTERQGEGRRVLLREKAMMKTLGLAVTLAAFAVVPAHADTTIGADVNHSFNGTGACNGGGNPLQRPCATVILSIPSRTVRSPCDGTVTRYRMNGIPSPNTYRLRVVHDNQNGTYTPTATSSPPVSIATSGVNEFAASVPIKQGELVALDFMDSNTVAIHYYYENNPGIQEAYFYTWPPDGTPDSPTGIETSYYLFNADVACGTGGQNATTTKKCKKKKVKREASAAKKKRCKKKKK
jgi:hypothetical protein